MHSDDPIQIEEPLTIFDVAREIENIEPDGNLERMAASFNHIVLQLEGDQYATDNSQVREKVGELCQGVAIIGR
ncbi:hypothetical protein [uncultured Propionivibrio sp.]|uniref:hypothetical protein n=1 Tax=uncultured Propionivibrio sp. TaxID=426737 RepID=UPI0029C0951B|nr:hypothetical protein [uncultured Propionivibrio sp.]